MGENDPTGTPQRQETQEIRCEFNSEIPTLGGLYRQGGRGIHLTPEA